MISLGFFTNTKMRAVEMIFTIVCTKDTTLKFSIPLNKNVISKKEAITEIVSTHKRGEYSEKELNSIKGNIN